VLANAYTDTSAFMKRFLAEKGSDEIDELIESGQYRLAVSSLTVTEFRSVLKRRQRENTSTAQFATKAITQLHEEIANGALRFHAIDAAIFNLAGELIDRLSAPLATLDAIHLACAKVTGAQVLISADKQLLRAAAEAGLQTVDLS
jgi:uncharacterized protein